MKVPLMCQLIDRAVATDRMKMDKNLSQTITVTGMQTKPCKAYSLYAKQSFSGELSKVRSTVYQLKNKKLELQIKGGLHK